MTNERPPRLDLNLLVILEMVISEGSLTRAATRLGTTQSAISHSIARLRELTGDPLFTRMSRGIVPTKRARAMAMDVRRSVEMLEQALGKAHIPFDPMTDRRRYLLHFPGGLECHLLPAILAAVSPRQGPRFRIVNSRSTKPLAEREPEETWLGIDYEPVTTGGFSSLHCADVQPLLMMRKGHPACAGTITRAAFEAAQHVVLVGIGDNRQPKLAASLEEGRIERDIRYSVSTIGALQELVAGSDMISTLLPSVARHCECSGRFEVRPLPFQIAPIGIYLVWRDEDQLDPGNAWLRALLREALCKS